MSVISNIRGSVDLEIVYHITDANDPLNVLEEISAKEFRTDFAGDVDRLEEHGTDTYGSIKIDEV